MSDPINEYISRRRGDVVEAVELDPVKQYLVERSSSSSRGKEETGFDVFKSKIKSLPDLLSPYEKKQLREINEVGGKILHGAMYYSGLEGLGRLWELPGNVLYGVWEGIKKGDIKEPWTAARKTVTGEGYYGLEQAGLPVAKNKYVRTAEEVAWTLIKNPLNIIAPWRGVITRGLPKPVQIPKEAPSVTAADVLRDMVKKEQTKTANVKPEQPWVPFKSAQESAGVFDESISRGQSAIGRRDLMEGLRREQTEKGIEYTPAEKRGVKSIEPGIAQRLAARLRDTSGGIEVELTDTEAAAVSALKSQAKKAGQKVEDVLKQMGFKPEEIVLLQRRIAETEPQKVKKIPNSKNINARVAKPPVAPKGVNDQVPISDLVESMDGPPGDVAGFGTRAKHGTSETFLSPETVFNRDKVVGAKIYRNMDLGDQAFNKFMYKEATEYEKARKGIKPYSESSFRIGRVLDGKLDPKTLTKKETKLYDFFTKKYDFLIHKYIKQLTGKRYDYIVDSAGKQVGPFVKISELSAKDQLRYNTMKAMATAMRAGQKVSDLTGKTKKLYNNYMKGMQKILHKEWLARLSPNEREAFLLLKRKIKNYFPHMWDRGDLLRKFKTDLNEIKTKIATETDIGKIRQMNKRVKQLEDNIQTMEGGGMVLYDQLPKEYQFKSFEPRRANLPGYSFDSVSAYDRYLHGIGMRMFINPAIRKNAELHKSLNPTLRSYHKKWTRRYLGMDRHKLDDVVNLIASYEWVRTLGVNPRSPLGNLTQRINTLADAGAWWSSKGQAHALTPKGRALFNSTGAAQEIPTVMVEGWGPRKGFMPVKPTKLTQFMDKAETIRKILGWMFNKVELGNRRHAFSTGYLRAVNKGMTEEAAVQAGLDLMHKTQFRYGKVGMPMAFTHPAGRLPLQFWSYSIKQLEFLARLTKENPLKLAKYIMISEGVNYSLREFCDIDMSNYIGFPITLGRAIQMIRDAGEGDIEGAITNAHLMTKGGGGLLPSGLGPAVTGVVEIFAAHIKDRSGFYQTMKEVLPVQAWRMYKGYESFINKQGKLYPVLDKDGDPMYMVTPWQLAKRTFGPRPGKEHEEMLQWNTEIERAKERKVNLEKILDAYADGESGKAQKLMLKSGVRPTPRQIMLRLLRKNVTRRQWNLIRRKFDKDALYYLEKEGELPFEEID